MSAAAARGSGAAGVLRRVMRGALRSALGGHLQRGSARERASPRGWSLAGMRGRLVEVSGEHASAALTAALGLVREAQLLSEAVAWVALRSECFFPPDAADGGVDLAALPVVRVPRPADLARAADRLARSGAFGLVAVDLVPLRTLRGASEARAIPPAALSRLLGLARKHDLALLFLTWKPRARSSIGSLVSLRAHATRRREGMDAFACTVQVLKDKRHAPGWSHEEVCRGPAGLH